MAWTLIDCDKFYRQTKLFECVAATKPDDVIANDCDITLNFGMGLPTNDSGRALAQEMREGNQSRSGDCDLKTTLAE